MDIQHNPPASPSSSQTPAIKINSVLFYDLTKKQHISGSCSLEQHEIHLKPSHGQAQTTRINLKTVFAIIPTPRALLDKLQHVSWNKAAQWMTDHMMNISLEQIELETSNHRWTLCALEKARGSKPPILTFHFIECGNPLDAGKFYQTVKALLKSIRISECEKGSVDFTNVKTTVAVLLNPFGGKKKAKHIYKKWVLPILTVAGYNAQLYETERRNHAKDIAHDMDLRHMAAIITVSGDGLFHEVLNGLLSRKDWREAIATPVGIIPAGSGNALAASLGVLHPMTATISIAKRATKKYDVMCITQGSKTYYAHLLVTWAYIADIDIESDKFRWMGPLRFEFVAILRALHIRKYRGRLCYLPETPVISKTPSHSESELLNRPPLTMDSSITGLMSTAAEAPPLLDSGYARRKSFTPRTSAREEDIDSSASDHFGPKSTYRNAFSNCHLPAGWVELPEKSFSLFLAMNPTHASYNFPAAPDALSNDGLLNLLYLGRTTPWTFLQAIANLESGSHLKKLQQVKCKAFALHPFSKEDEMQYQNSLEPRMDGAELDRFIRQHRYRPEGIMDVDGEQEELTSIIVECMEKMISMITLDVSS